jgi:ribosomal protein L4
VVVPEKNDKLVKSAQNIASVELRAVDNISVYDVLNAERTSSSAKMTSRPSKEDSNNG